MTPGIAEPHPSKLTGFPAWIVLILIPEMSKKNPDELSDNLSLPDNHDREIPVKPIFMEKLKLLASLYRTKNT